MKFEKSYVLPKFGSDGNVASTMIVIRSGDITSIAVEVSGDYRNKTDDELVAIALEEFYQVVYPNRAEKEAIATANAAAEAAKEQADKAMPTLVNGNTFAAMIAGEMIANDRNLWPDQYKGLVAFLPEAKTGDIYEDGQYIKVKDPSIPENDKKGQYVCVRLCKGSEWTCNGEDILGTPNPYKNGYDIRRYESYPRVQLGTAADTKK